MAVSRFVRKHLSPTLLAFSVAAALCGGLAASGEVGDPNYVPVTRRPRSEVLAKGADYLRPDLTRAAGNDYREP